MNKRPLSGPLGIALRLKLSVKRDRGGGEGGADGDLSRESDCPSCSLETVVQSLAHVCECHTGATCDPDVRQAQLRLHTGLHSPHTTSQPLP